MITFTEPVPEAGELYVANATGHFDLVWEIRPKSQAPNGNGLAAFPDLSGLTYELQSARTADFEPPLPHYRGPQTQTFISGLEGRTHYFRVRAVESSGEAAPWSEPVAVKVEYVRLQKVFLLMGAGFLCLFATAFIIIRGSLQSAQTEDKAA